MKPQLWYDAKSDELEIYYANQWVAHRYDNTYEVWISIWAYTPAEYLKRSYEFVGYL